jgi:hypothetical protein
MHVMRTCTSIPDRANILPLKAFYIRGDRRDTFALKVSHVFDARLQRVDREEGCQICSVGVCDDQDLHTRPVCSTSTIKEASKMWHHQITVPPPYGILRWMDDCTTSCGSPPNNWALYPTYHFGCRSNEMASIWRAQQALMTVQALVISGHFD